MKSFLLAALFLPLAANCVGQQPLAIASARHFFSNTAQKDSFVLVLTGRSVVNGRINFRIFRDNTPIFSESFSAFDLLGDEADLIKTDRKKADTILARMKRFFTEENFIRPAIKITADGGSDPADYKEILAEIKSDRSATGFVYSHGYEGTYALVYSRKKQKAVCYYSSD